MALRAGLAPPRPEAQSAWHKPTFASISLAAITKGDRRLEAEAYLTGGYGLRLRLESRPAAVKLQTLARVWQPSRLKGIQVSRAHGTPFLAATQVFDIRPTPRKWLAVDRTPEVADRFVKPSTILVTCSGAVGLATMAHSPLEGVLISHDLLRCEPHNDLNRGWLYAFLRTRTAREMMQSAQYGHVIKHLECAHLNSIPLPVPPPAVLERFNERVRSVFQKRDEAHSLVAQAEERLREFIGGVPRPSKAEEAFSIRASALFGGRRRLEANFHNPRAASILRAYASRQVRTQPAAELTEGIWWGARFKRIFGEEGVPYLSAEDLFRVNPPITKRVLAEQAEEPERFYVKRGWLVMACSGQAYGLLGSVALMTAHHEKAFFSHDLIRVVPKGVRGGYLFACLGHPDFGRPLLVRLAYGTSIPHIDPDDVAQFPVPRLAARDEDEIADAMERASNLRAESDEEERALTEDAEDLVGLFASTGGFVRASDTGPATN